MRNTTQENRMYDGQLNKPDGMDGTLYETSKSRLVSDVVNKIVDSIDLIFTYNNIAFAK